MSRRSIPIHPFAFLALAGFAGCADGPELGEFVYVKVIDGNFEIVRGSVADSARIRIASHPALDYRPDWTPDGTGILFYSDRRWRYDFDIFVTDTLGSYVKNLTPLLLADMNPAVGPDGRIAFVSARDGDRELFTMDMDGGDVRRLTENEERYDDAPAWSPDGTRIAYSSIEDDDGDIFILEVASLETHRLVHRPGFDGIPTWSPDGRFIAFGGASGDSVSLWVVGADGSGLRRIPPAFADERHPDWSPDGEWLIFTASTGSGEQLNSDLWIMRPDGSDRRQITDAPGREEMAVWRPGTRVPLRTGGRSRAVPAEAAAPAPSFALDWPRIAETMIGRMQLQRGERVLLVGRPNRFEPLVAALRAAVTAAGGVDLGALSVERGAPFPGDSTQFLRWAATATDRAGLAALMRENVDVAVMLPEAQAGEAYLAMQDVLRGGRARTIHFHWEGAYQSDGTAIPSVGGEPGSVPRDVIDAAYQRALLETDYVALAGAQRAFEAAMRGQEVRITTPAGTDLRFRIGDRPVTKQGGDASAARASQARNLIDREIELPAGAIRVAPIEESVSGTIAFPPAAWSGQSVAGLSMTFERGRLADWSARSGAEAVRTELEQAGEPATRFREFALGFNPLLPVSPDRSWIPYYGYGAGVVRLSLGDNTELGGRVGGGYVRWNFFTDATVTVGGEVWVDGGRLVR